MAKQALSGKIQVFLFWLMAFMAVYRVLMAQEYMVHLWQEKLKINKFCEELGMIFLMLVR